MRLLMERLGVGSFTTPSEGWCGDCAESDEREVLLLRRGEEADWRRANEEDERRAEFGVRGPLCDAAPLLEDVLARRSCDRETRRMLLFRSSWSCPLVA